MAMQLLIFTALCVGSHAGTIILSSQEYAGGHNIYALDAKTGDKKWTYKLGYADYPALVTVSRDGKTAFVYDEKSTILALDVKSGTKVWAYKAPPLGYYAADLSGPLLSNDGSTIFINRGYETAQFLGALDSATGKPKWWFKDEYAAQAGYPTGAFYPAISPDDATVYWTTQSCSLFAVHAGNGTLRWVSKRLNDIATNPSVSPDGSKIFVGGYTSRLTAWWPDGTIAWRSASLSHDYLLAKSAVKSDSKIVFVGDYDGYITALDTNTGSKLWKYRVSYEFYISNMLLLSDDDTTLFVPGRNFYALAASNGKRRWDVSRRGWEPSGDFCLGDGLLFVPFEKGIGSGREAHDLFAFNPQTGKVVWAKEGFQRNAGKSPYSTISWSPVEVENLITDKLGTSNSVGNLASDTDTWTEMPVSLVVGLLIGMMVSSSITCFCVRFVARPLGVSTNVPLLGDA